WTKSAASRGSLNCWRSTASVRCLNRSTSPDLRAIAGSQNHLYRPPVKPLHWFLALSFSGLVALLPIDTRAQDWPQFLGPNRNLKTTGTNLNFTWPGGDAPVLWRKDIGSGWSG